MVDESTAVVHDLGHTGGLRALGDECADALGCIDRGSRALLALLGLDRRGGRDRAPVEVVDDLHGDVLVAPVHGETRTFRGARDLLADATVPAKATRVALA